VIAAVDPNWRRGATQGHSGTHMVHAALREVLGPNAVQAGSLEPARDTCGSTSTRRAR
jgi:alanyl-tRNA synthetase